MKTFLFAFLPIITFAQNQFLPDTSSIINGKTTTYFTSNNPIEGKGRNKINSDLETINSFSGKIEKENKKSYLNSPFDQLEQKRWSFGFLVIPYYSNSGYNVFRNGNNPPAPAIYTTTQNEINTEAQLSYGVLKNVRFTFDASYSSNSSQTSYERHYRNTGYQSDNGYESTIGVKLFDFNLGLKYTLNNFITDKVNIFVLAAFGKQIAFTQNNYKDLFPDTMAVPVIEDNIGDFIKQLNSPWHFNFGFGAEYFFNESIALVSSIRVIYSSSTGTYNSRYIFNEETASLTEKDTFAEFSTRIGFGLNLYF